MAGEIGAYTTALKVRAVAGVTDDEVDDATLLSMELDSALAADLYAWLPNHSALWAAGADSASPAPTEAQKQIRRLIALYATRFCALGVLNAPMHLPLQVGNGKDTAKRFSDDTLAEAKAELKNTLAEYRRQLLELIAPAVTYSGSGLFAIASPNTDPVTNT